MEGGDGKPGTTGQRVSTAMCTVHVFICCSMLCVPVIWARHHFSLSLSLSLTLALSFYHSSLSLSPQSLRACYAFDFPLEHHVDDKFSTNSDPPPRYYPDTYTILHLSWQLFWAPVKKGSPYSLCTQYAQWSMKGRHLPWVGQFQVSGFCLFSNSWNAHRAIIMNYIWGIQMDDCPCLCSMRWCFLCGVLCICCTTRGQDRTSKQMHRKGLRPRNQILLSDTVLMPSVTSSLHYIHRGKAIGHAEGEESKGGLTMVVEYRTRV